MQIIRVKRKRDLTAPQNLYIHHQRHAAADDSVENLVQELSVSEKRPTKYCRMMSVTLSEMGTLSPEVFEKQLMGSGEVQADVEVQGDGLARVEYSVTRRKRGRTGVDMNDGEDPLKRMGVYRICDIECRVAGEEHDSQTEEAVFDLYIQKDEPREQQQEEEESLQQQVLYLGHDDFFMPEECFDAIDSFDDTEDSNAEDYYANDYPDDDVWNDSDTDEAGFADMDRHLEQAFGGFYDSSEYGSSDDCY